MGTPWWSVVKGQNLKKWRSVGLKGAFACLAHNVLVRQTVGEQTFENSWNRFVHKNTENITVRLFKSGRRWFCAVNRRPLPGVESSRYPVTPEHDLIRKNFLVEIKHRFRVERDALPCVQDPVRYCSLTRGLQHVKPPNSFSTGRCVGPKKASSGGEC